MTRGTYPSELLPTLSECKRKHIFSLLNLWVCFSMNSSWLSLKTWKEFSAIPGASALGFVNLKK